MMSMESMFNEMEHISKSILYDLEKGNLKWDDESVQFFLPLAIYFTNWDWLELAAKNILIEEDFKIVKDFLSKVQSIAEYNQDSLDNAVGEKLKGVLGDL